MSRQKLIHERIVVIAYGAVLHRAPESIEIEVHVSDLGGGVAIADVLKAIAARRDGRNLWFDRKQTFTSAAADLLHLETVTLPIADLRLLFRASYEAFLAREASDDEVAHYVALNNSGIPLVNLVAAISESEEALGVWERCQVSNNGVLTAQPSGLNFQRADGYSVSFDELSAALAQAEKETGHTFSKGVGLALAVVIDTLGINSKTPQVRVPEPVCAFAPELHDDIEKVVRILYRRILKREAAQSEVALWHNHYTQSYLLSSIILAVEESEEARALRAGVAEEEPPGTQIQMAYEIIMNRGASAQDVDAFRIRIERTDLNINDVVTSFFKEAATRRLNEKGAEPSNDPGLAYLFGSHGVVKLSDWKLNAHDRLRKKSHDALAADSVLSFPPARPGKVGIITSVFKGGRYIEAFLENITSQTIFQERCELILIDAASPENEYKTIEKYMRKFSNIVYRRTDTVIGIYEAWNLGVRMSTADYLTNANVDDCRRGDSLEFQAAILDNLRFADVVYQDVAYYSSVNARFDEIEKYNLITNLPVMSNYNIAEFNSPHNGPMWRKKLHEEVGFFNENYKSAADYEFWIRCLVAKKNFYKLNDPHVGYYVNPHGLSTRADSRGVVESHAISKQFFRQLVSPLLTMTDNAFAERVGIEPSAEAMIAGRYQIVQDALVALGEAYRAGWRENS